MNLRIILRGRPYTKKNHSQIIKAGNRRMVIPSPEYRQYEKECMYQIPPKAKQRIDFPVNVQCVYYMGRRNRVDISNLNSAMHDILVAAHVLSDDNRDVVAGTDGSRVFYDKNNPRVEITITSMAGYEQWKKY